MGKKLTTEEFIEKARKIHGDKYDYSKVVYVNTKTKVCIICPEHGEFWMKPNDHLCRQYGCHKCGWIKEGKNLRKTTEEFIKEAVKKYGNKFDYSKVEYITNNKKVCIISHEKDKYGVEIGEFWQTPSNHLSFGYPSNKIIMTTERFVKRARVVHGDFFNYDKTDYKNAKEPVIITCPIHGDFEQLPHLHLRGEMCPKCRCKSVLENKVRIILTDLNIEFNEQKRFEFLGRQSLDFYLPKYKIGIECQGRQHFIGSKLWEDLDTIKERDKFKKDICEKNGIKIIYTIDKKYKNIDSEIYTENNTYNIENIKELIIDQVIKKEDEK